MITSFIYVGREALEMMFLTLMVATAITASTRVYGAAAIGILSGIVVGYFAGELLEPYEVLMYALLSGMMFWLFFTSERMASHIKGHVESIEDGFTLNERGAIAGLFAIWFIYARESMEIFVFMFQATNNNSVSWLSAALAAALVFGSFPIIKTHVKPATLFTATRYAFLVFGVWFGYEALEHMHIF